MIEHIWTVLCSKATTDKDSNNISLIEVIERLVVETPEEAPDVPLHLELITLWSRENLDEGVKGRARVRFLSPEGDMMSSEIPYSIDLTNYTRMRHGIRSQAIQIKGPGKYVFEIALEKEGDWVTVARIPLEVHRKKPKD